MDNLDLYLYKYNNKLGIFLTAIIISTLPFVWLIWDSPNLSTLANVVGFIGGTLLLWQFVMGNRFISSLISQDYIRNTKLHIFLGTYGTVMVLLHPILETAVYWPTNLLSLSGTGLGSRFDYLLFLGKSAFSLFLIIWITSALLRSKIKYRPWHYIHYLAYPTISFMFLHSRGIGTYLNSIPLLRSYWNLLTLIFVVGIIIRLLAFFNVFKRRYEFLSKKHLDGEIVKYIFQAKDGLISPKSGQFVYLRPFFFAEAHPYTIADFDDNRLTFCIKKVGRHSKSMDNLKQGDVVYVDGPYGVFTREGHNDNPKIIIAGGIGITPFITLVKNYANEDTYMFYSNKFLNFAVMRDFFKNKLSSRYVDLVTEEKQKGVNIESVRLNKNIIEKYIDKEVLEKANVFLCGSVEFMKAVEEILLELRVPRERIYVEEFSL